MLPVTAGGVRKDHDQLPQYPLSGSEQVLQETLQWAGFSIRSQIMPKSPA